MIDFFFWVLGLVTFLALVGFSGIAVLYIVYAIIHRDEYGHIQHIDDTKEVDLKPMVGVVMPKESFTTYNRLTNSERKE